MGGSSKPSTMGALVSQYYTYNSKNQIILIQLKTGSPENLTKELFFEYDVLGRRIYKKVKDYTDTTSLIKNYARFYVYEGSQTAADYDTNGNLLAKYLHQPGSVDDLISVNISSAGVSAKMAKASGIYFFLKDHQGSTTAITNAAGQIVQRYKYTSFGNILKIVDGSNLPIETDLNVNTRFTYTGREYDSETDLYFYRARYYNARLGRFLQEDPYPGDLSNPLSVTNKYIYTYNNPVNLSDPSGQDAFGGTVTYVNGGNGDTSSNSENNGTSWGWGRSSEIGRSNRALSPVTPPESYSETHLANAVQFVSLFIPEIKNAHVYTSSGENWIENMFEANTMFLLNKVWVNSNYLPGKILPTVDDNGKSRTQLSNLLNTVLHEGIHLRDGPISGLPYFHENVFKEAKKLEEKQISNFLRIYYGE